MSSAATPNFGFVSAILASSASIDESSTDGTPTHIPVAQGRLAEVGSRYEYADRSSRYPALPANTASSQAILPPQFQSASSQLHNQQQQHSSQTSPSAARSASEPQRKKRAQVTTACNECRRRKIKCDGQRPACYHCIVRPTTCQYEADPDVTPSLALRRKYDDLQERAHDNQEFINLLRQLPLCQATTLLSVLRSTSSVEATLAHHRRQCAMRADASPGSLTTLDPLPRPNSVALSDQNPPSSPLSLVVYGFDISQVSLTYWGISYLDLHSFAGILASYFTWDHPSWCCFDSDSFLAGLLLGGNEECSRLLLNCILAVGSKNYKLVDPILGATVEHFALVEAKRLWELDAGNDRTVNIPAGILLHHALCCNGSDKEGYTYLVGAVRIARNLGLYKAQPSGPDFAPSDDSPTRAKTHAAWGIFAYASCVAMTMHDEPLITMAPTTLMPPARGLTGYESTSRQAPGTRRPDDDVRSMRRVDLTSVLLDLWTAGMKVNLFHKSRGIGALTMLALRRAEDLYDSLMLWYRSLSEEVRSLSVADAHVLIMHMQFYHIILELFRPFVVSEFTRCSNSTAQNTGISAIRHAAGRPILEAHAKLRELLTLYSSRHSGEPYPFGLNACILDVAFDSIACLQHTADAESNLLLCLSLLRRMAQIFDIDRYLLEGIKRAALLRRIELPQAVWDAFDEVQRDQPWVPGMQIIRSAYPVDQWLVHEDTDAARLDNLVGKTNKLAVEQNMSD